MDSYPITVTLPQSTVYVSGTVNGVEVTWTNVQEYDWQAMADRVDNEIYEVELTIIDSLGITSYAEFTLYYGLLNLITDRTQADVNRVIALSAKGWQNMTTDEQTEYLSSLKGAYNASDLNRVGAAVEYVRNRLAQYDYNVSVNPKQSWTYTDIPTPQELDEYLEDIRTIRSALATKPTTPQVPETMEQFTYIEANNIEQILLDVDILITNMTLSFVFCGQPLSGQIWEEFTA